MNTSRCISSETRTSIDVRTRIFNRFTAGLVGILLSLLLVPSAMKAQCGGNLPGPTPGIPNPNGCGGNIPAWTGPSTAPVTVGSCTLTVTYCIREIVCWPTATQTTWQVHVIGFYSSSGCSLTVDQMTAAIESDPIAFSPTGYTPPTCGGSYVPWTFVIYMPACLKYVQTNPDTYSDCDDNAAFCTATFTECTGSGGIQWSNPSFSRAGDTPDCSANSAPIVGDCFKPACGS